MGETEVNTYSIVARCARTGELGCAVASAVPAVGAICAYLRSGVGAVSTQSWVNPYLADAILDRLAGGVPAAEAIAGVMADDEASAFRQVGAIGASAPGGAWTGESCTEWRGQRTGPDFAIQGNMLIGPGTLEAMETAFLGALDQPLEERLMRALEAAQAVGGDKRGRQSAALSVVGGEAYPRVDLRVDEHADPVTELRRVLTVATAQLAPFVAGMPRRGQAAAPAPDSVVEMLLKSPPDRPAGGGSSKP